MDNLRTQYSLGNHTGNPGKVNPGEAPGDVTELVSGEEEGVPAILSATKKLGGTPWNGVP